MQYVRYRPSLSIRDKQILSLDRLLHMDYDRKSSAAKHKKREKQPLIKSVKKLGAKTI
jgi:hypothetical protein